MRPTWDLNNEPDPPSSPRRLRRHDVPDDDSDDGTHLKSRERHEAEDGTQPPEEGDRERGCGHSKRRPQQQPTGTAAKGGPGGSEDDREFGQEAKSGTTTSGTSPRSHGTRAAGGRRSTGQRPN